MKAFLSSLLDLDLKFNRLEFFLRSLFVFFILYQFIYFGPAVYELATLFASFIQFILINNRLKDIGLLNNKPKIYTNLASIGLLILICLPVFNIAVALFLVLYPSEVKENV